MNKISARNDITLAQGKTDHKNVNSLQLLTYIFLDPDAD